MTGKKPHHHIIEQVPPDYYQKGIANNLLQRMWHTQKLHAVFRLITVAPRNVLDVGCASGWFLSRLVERFPKAKAHGIDLYERAIAYGKNAYPHIHFHVADAHNLPFKRETFDLVICTEVLEHVDNPKEVLLEIKRVLKNDGVAIIELDSGSWLFSVAWFLWRKLNGKVWNDSHLHSFNVKKLERLLISCGFEIVKKREFSHGMAMAFLLKKK